MIMMMIVFAIVVPYLYSELRAKHGNPTVVNFPLLFSSTVALRWLLYIALIIFALFYLMPLFVMLATSLKSLEEIRTGSLIAFPGK